MAATNTMDVHDVNGRRGSLSYNTFYEYLSRKCLTENQLKSNNYPRPHPSGVQGKAKLFSLPHKFLPVIPSRNSRNCRFCKNIYAVDSQGNEVYPSECEHHPFRQPKYGEKYRCCGKDRNAQPCRIKSFHCTSDIDPENLNNFLVSKYLPNTGKAIYAVDCEFVHTKAGLEVASIIILDHKEQVVLDTLIRPTTPIIDYLYEFSKLTADSFRTNCISNAEFREKLASILGPEMITIGHSIREDFLRMNLIHDKVVDTAIIYPHPNGIGSMYSLKDLAERYLGHLSIPSYHNSKAYEDCVKGMRLAKLAAWNNKLF